MLFNSIEYLFLFIPIVFICYFLLNKFKLFKTATLFLFLASLYFYASYKLDYVYIILVSIAFNYFISSLFKKDLSQSNKKLTVFIGVAGNILLLIFFKYFKILMEALNTISLAHFNAIEIIIPLGISYFTLQQISYIVDCYKGTVENYNLLDYALFVCFFPQFVAGPIVRHQEMIPQFRNPKNRVINQENIFIGIFLITVGLLKKTVFADGFADFINNSIMHNLVYYDFYLSWFWGCTKVLQGYFDYSGYCDMALGSAFLFNISLPWNFNSPYKAVSIIDYWKRWNMTLVRFLKDYIYKPLGADKNGFFQYFINIMIVFLTMGIWIGTNFANIIYGILNGIFVCINKLWEKLNISIPKVFATLITFICIVISNPFIFSRNITESIAIIKTMFGLSKEFPPFIVENFNFVFSNPFPGVKLNYILLLAALFIVFFCKNSTELSRIYVKANNTFYTILLGIIFLYASLSITKSEGFIYFNF